MPTIIDQRQRTYSLIRLTSEGKFEEIVQQLSAQIFGPASIYIPIKRRVGRENLVTIPDGYVVDMADPGSPKLYVVENEIVSHDPFKHIGIQMLKFVTSFDEIQIKVRNFIMEHITSHKKLLAHLEESCQKSNCRNIDEYLDRAVYREFHGIVVIDEAQEELHRVLQKINADISVLELKTFESEEGTRVYAYDTLYDDEEEIETTDKKRKVTPLSPADLVRMRERRLKCDTIIVPAQPDGFKRVFIGENQWWAIRIGPAMKDRIKYIAAYQVKPISAVTHMAEVAEIKPHKDSGKYVVVFKQPAAPVGPIKPKDSKFSPQGPIYVQKERLLAAKTLEDALRKIG
jgi:hypothetical protein